MTPIEFEARIAELAARHGDALGYSGFEDAVGIVGPLRRATLAGGGRVVDVYLYPDGGAGLRVDRGWIAYERFDYSDAATLLDDAFDRLAAAVELMVR
ncbi:MAG: hypothetical protein JWM53_2675 [bacterium]|nr:hypothetical protein [bacterium]